MRNLFTGMIILMMLTSCQQQAKEHKEVEINLEKFADGIHHWELFAEDLDYKRLDTNEYEAIADNIVQFQNADGGWPKNMDWLADFDVDSMKNTLSDHNTKSTFDNDNTHPQIDFLAKMYTRTGKAGYKKSAEKGLRYILDTQHKSGGWRGWDVDGITYNDNVMVGIMQVLLDIKQGKSYYRWVHPSMHEELIQALDRALNVTLRCQITGNGQKKGWCQQHDHETLKPVQGRSYELPSVASRETVGIVHFLMRIENPDERVIAAIENAVSWLEISGLENIRIDTIQISPDTYPGQNLDIDRVAVTDSTAKTIWARFYEIDDNTPIFCTRGVKKYISLPK